MCVVSMIAEHYGERYRRRAEPLFPNLDQPNFLQQPQFVFPSPVTREEFEALRKDVNEMVALLKKAQEYDKRNNEPKCETEEKMALIRAVAKAAGVDLDKVMRE